jgi:hypothetical protein
MEADIHRMVILLLLGPVFLAVAILMLAGEVDFLALTK